MEDVIVKQRFLTYLKRKHTGEGKAVQSKSLEESLNLSGRKIRDIINALRCEGYPICSDENGYYYAVNENEIRRSINQLNSRIEKIAEAKSGLEDALSFLKNSSYHVQLKLWIVHAKGE